jgi:very-short-patch-repair endonuclease
MAPYNHFGFDQLAYQIADMVKTKVLRLEGWDYLRCESPIETLLATALFALSDYDDPESPRHTLICNAGDWEANKDHPQSEIDIFVERQVQLGAWRVDFLIHRYNHALNPSERGWRHLVVECDGHDYHERTKEQASRDRSRDRAAALSGIPCLRFTGSEIWRDPLGCAQQILDWFIFDSIRDERKNKRGSEMTQAESGTAR